MIQAEAGRGRINVVVRHGEPLLARGVEAVLADVPGIRLIDPAQRSADGSPLVLITDWRAGVEGSDRARGHPAPEVRVLVISAQLREQPARSALRQGLHGLLLATCSARELVSAVLALAAGRSYVCAEVAQRMAEGFCREPLTAREEEVLGLLSRGRCNKAIGLQLGIAPGTVKSHVKAILGKLAASSRTEAASIATELGIIDLTRDGGRPAVWRGQTPAQPLPAALAN